MFESAPATETLLTPSTTVERFGVTPVPFQFLVEGRDHLQIDSFNSQSGVVLALSLRFWDTTRDEIIATVESHTPNTDRTKATSRHRLGVGAVLNVRIAAISGSPRIGQTFTIVRVIRGFEGGRTVLGTLLQGYVTSEQDLAWPGSPLESSISGGGVIRTITGTNPAASTEIAEVVPTGARWQLLAFAAELAPSATPANRLPALEFHTGTFPLVRSPHAGAVGASNTRQWTWAGGMMLATLLSDGNRVQGIPVDFPLLAGQIIQTHTDGLQAGDDWSAPVYTVREWLEAQ